MKRHLTSNSNKQLGFTLIEVLLVIVVVGMMVAAIQINFVSNKAEVQLEQETRRFAGIFNLAAEYSLLNNIELGLYLDQTTYQFVGYDGVKWTPLNNNEQFSEYQLPDEIKVSLIFDDLPLEEPSLINRELFVPEDEIIEQMEEELSDNEKLLIPQVYILSGGDITPFQLVFSYAESSFEQADTSFVVTGLYSTPVTVSGPLIDGESIEERLND